MALPAPARRRNKRARPRRFSPFFIVPVSKSSKAMVVCDVGQHPTTKCARANFTPPPPPHSHHGAGALVDSTLLPLALVVWEGVFECAAAASRRRQARTACLASPAASLFERRIHRPLTDRSSPDA